MYIRRKHERGYFDFGWLKTYHSFSFGEYHDERHMGFRSLRVINEDLVAPGQGFPMHGHRDMEILTYLLSGKLEHKDSMGTGSQILPGDLQYMSAGKGVTHSEFNPSMNEAIHLLQIWILPSERGLPPRYAQKSIPEVEKLDRWRLIASPDGAEDSIAIRQDARLYASVLKKDARISRPITNGRAGWLHVAKGTVEAGGETLVAGDALAVEGAFALDVKGVEQVSEFLFFDLI